MNNHKMACILLGVCVFAMGFGVNKLRGMAVEARLASEEAKRAAETAEQQKTIAEIKLKNLDSKTSELRKIYGEWLPHFESFRNTGDGEQRIAEVVREGDVFLLSQKFQAVKIENGGFLSHALNADLIVEDDYSKVMNWLGKLEERIPSCQISRCKLTRGDRGNDVHLELRLQVPVLRQPTVTAAVNTPGAG